MSEDFEREIEQNYAAGVAMTAALQYLNRCAPFELGTPAAVYAADILRANVRRCQKIIEWCEKGDG